MKDNVLITKESVTGLARRIALGAMKKMRGYSHTLNQMYYGLVKDCNTQINIEESYSDGYDVVQEVSCYLCNYFGHYIKDVCVVDRSNKQITILLGAIRTAVNYIARQKTYITNTASYDYYNLPEPLPTLKFTKKDYQTVIDTVTKLKLTKLQKETLYNYYKGMGCSLIAEIMGVSPTTISKRRIAIRNQYKNIILGGTLCIK